MTDTVMTEAAMTETGMGERVTENMTETLDQIMNAEQVCWLGGVNRRFVKRDITGEVYAGAAIC
jgi:hypothetical protein